MLKIAALLVLEHQFCIRITVYPRLSEQVELKFLLGRSDTQKIRIIEEEHFIY